MLLKLFNNKSISSGIFILIVCALLWTNNFLEAVRYQAPAGENAMPLFALISSQFITTSVWTTIIAFVLVSVNSFIISWLNFGFHFLPHRSWLPGFVYFLAISAVPSLRTLHPVHFATLLILLSLYLIFATYHRTKEIGFTFNASFVLSLATLFYLPTILLLPLIWISIFILQKSDNWRLIVIPLWGLCLPWLFAWSAMFLTDSFVKGWNAIVDNFWSDNNGYLFDSKFMLFTGFVVLLSTLGGVSLLSKYGVKKVQSRKFFSILSWMLCLIVISMLILPSTGVGIIALIFVPIAYFISHFFMAGRGGFWRETIFIIYLGTMIWAIFN